MKDNFLYRLARFNDHIYITHKLLEKIYTLLPFYTIPFALLEILKKKQTKKTYNNKIYLQMALTLMENVIASHSGEATAGFNP